MSRPAQVAGQFYPADREELDRTVEGYLGKGKAATGAVAIIVPHAGYIYSGRVAGMVYAKVVVPDDLILIGPNHTGLGDRAAVMTSGRWSVPTGEVDINEALATRLLESSDIFTADPMAHAREHSLEVQLPFIIHLNPKATIVPLTVMHTDFNSCREMGEAIAGVIKGHKGKVLLIVSSDMNHYESEKETREKDQKAIDRVLELDARGLIDVTTTDAISMCGVVPAAIAITAARRLNASGAELVAYATSGETSGDLAHVVGYAGLIMN